MLGGTTCFQPTSAVAQNRNISNSDVRKNLQKILEGHLRAKTPEEFAFIKKVVERLKAQLNDKVYPS